MNDTNKTTYVITNVQKQQVAVPQDAKRYIARRKAIFLARSRMQVTGPRETEDEFNAEYDASCDKNIAGYVTDHRGVWVKDGAVLASDPQPPQAARVPMTDDEINALYQASTGQSLRPQDYRLAREFARAVLAARGAE